MKMIVAALVGGAVIGFVEAKLLSGEIQQHVTDPGMQGFAAAGVAAFLGAIWGWVAKGLAGGKPRD